MVPAPSAQAGAGTADAAMAALSSIARIFVFIQIPP